MLLNLVTSVSASQNYRKETALVYFVLLISTITVAEHIIVLFIGFTSYHLFISYMPVGHLIDAWVQDMSLSSFLVKDP